MSQSIHTTDLSANVSEPRASGDAGTRPTELMRRLTDAVPSTLAFIATTFPRGELQLMQPPHAVGGVLKDYAREFQFEDRVVWRAVIGRRTVRSSDVWPDATSFEESRFFSAFLRPAGLAYVMAAPLRAPLLSGYPGVLWVARSREKGDFTPEEMQALTEVAEGIDQESARDKCKDSAPEPWAHRLPVRFFVFDSRLEQLLPDAGGNAQMDAKLLSEIRNAVSERLQQMNGELIEGRRLTLPDSHGDLWTFRIIAHKRFPALGDGSFVVLCLSPVCGDWASVQPAALGADAELSRLVPSLHFLQQQFRTGPTLGDIAKAVHLSPFHFHRRFTELFGQTPKHFLLECQIHAAKQELVAREKELSQIATDCGFAHQSHFTSRFKQATGLTPTRWRRVATEGR